MKKRIAAVVIMIICVLFVLDLIGVMPDPFPHMFITPSETENPDDSPAGVDESVSDPGENPDESGEPSDNPDGASENPDGTGANPGGTSANPGNTSGTSGNTSGGVEIISGIYNPLSGLEMDETQVNLRPVAVILNNLKKAQPQLGVSQADIIYEIPVEGGITRMLAVYQSMDGVGSLGSIRSARPYLLEIALGLDALFVHAGGSTEAYRDIASWKVDNMDGVRGGSDANIFWRDAVRRRTMGYEHSMLTSGENVQKYLERGRYRTEHAENYVYPQTYVTDGTPVNGSGAEKISVEFSTYKTGVFTYDAQKKQYLISQYGSAYNDGNTSRQVGVTNLLVLETDMKVLDSEGRLQVRMTGTGQGNFYCGGKTVPIVWHKESRSTPFSYTLTDGTPLSLGAGHTYICIIDPEESTVSVS